MVMLFARISNIVLMPRIGPKVLVAAGMLLAAAGMAWLTRIGVHSDYATAIVGPMLVTGAGIGLSMSPSMNTTTAFWWTAGIVAAAPSSAEASCAGARCPSRSLPRPASPRASLSPAPRCLPEPERIQGCDPRRAGRS